MPDTPEEINGRLFGRVARLEAELDAALAELGRVRDRNTELREALRELVQDAEAMLGDLMSLDMTPDRPASLDLAYRALGEPQPEPTEGDRARSRARGDAG